MSKLYPGPVTETDSMGLDPAKLMERLTHSIETQTVGPSTDLPVWLLEEAKVMFESGKLKLSGRGWTVVSPPSSYLELMVIRALDDRVLLALEENDTVILRKGGKLNFLRLLR